MSSPRKYSFDSACLSLAEYFLGSAGTKEENDDLAQDIQDAVESWLEDHPGQLQAPQTSGAAS